MSLNVFEKLGGATFDTVLHPRLTTQVMGKVPTISINKTDGCQVYLSKDSITCEVISAKSSEMNVLVPKDDGDFVSAMPPREPETLPVCRLRSLSLSSPLRQGEFPLPEQYKTIWDGQKFVTIASENIG